VATKDDGEWAYRERGIWQDGIAAPASMPGDGNGDLHVDIFDINLISNNWGWRVDQDGAGSTSNADVNHDGTVDVFDVNMISAHWSPAGSSNESEADLGWHGDYRYQEPGNGSRAPPLGRWVASEYEVFATWVEGTQHPRTRPTRFSTATVLSGKRSATSSYLQSVLYDGRRWASLGTYQFSTGVISVVLSDQADGTVVADAILVAQTSVESGLRAPLPVVDTANPPGDLNRDGAVNGIDVEIAADNWGGSGPAGDANTDGVVDIFDVNWISSNWVEHAEGSFAAAAPSRTAMAMTVDQTEFMTDPAGIAAYGTLFARERMGAVGNIPINDAMGVLPRLKLHRLVVGRCERPSLGPYRHVPKKPRDSCRGHQ
jgi:hypothetical protein